MDNFNTEYFKKKLQINQCAEIRVVSNSMAPIIKIGEILHVKPVTSALSRFDIIIFDHYGQPTCHFFWAETPAGQICTKSLKFLFPSDTPFEKEKLIGIVPYKKISVGYKLLVTFVSIVRSR
jgi:hypothetical protein